VEFVSKTQVIVAIGAVMLALYVVELVRRRKLSEEYSLLWMVCSAVIAVLGFSTPLLKWITRLLGMYGEASTVYSFGLAFAVAMLLYLSVKLSRLGGENQVLARELALLRHEFEALGEPRGGRESR
jgi:hypothetical protein